ncbi:Uncharacterised protein [Enterobacter cloacae]|nr:Uncharacterised protein [Enterobacter cloacae]
MLLQPLRNCQCVGAVLLNAQREGANPPQRQETAERIQNAANRVLQIAQTLREILICPDNSQPGNHV